MVRTEDLRISDVFSEADETNDLRAAWQNHGEPTSWGNVQRRYKAYLAARAEPAEDEAPARAATAPSTVQTGAQATKKRARTDDDDGEPLRLAPATGKATRATSHQLEVDIANELRWLLEWKAQHKAATIEIDRLRKAKLLGKAPHTYASVALKYTAELAADSHYEITESALKNWVAKKKKPGTSPLPAGPAPSKPREALIAVLQSFARLSQLEGASKKPAELIAKALAAVRSCSQVTLLDSEAKRKRLLADLRKGPNALNSTDGESVSTRRIDALTHENVLEWFESWEKFLVDRGFGAWMLNNETGTRMVYVSKQKRRRLINGDETHEVMSTELEHGGPRARLYIDKLLGAAIRAMVVNQRHTSILFAMNFDGEMLPPYVEFDSGAKGDEGMQVHARWVNKLLPSVGLYGHAEKQQHPVGFEVSAKGGTVAGSFLRHLEKCVDPCYPNIAPEWEYDSDGSVDSVGDKPIVAGPVCYKTDAGPDRLDTDRELNRKRKQRHDDGLVVYPGIPNGTAVNQEMDQLYEEHKRLCKDVTLDIVTEREEAAAVARRKKQKKIPAVNLTNADLPRMIYGRRQDPPQKRPFEYGFAKEKLLAAMDKVGAVSSKGWVTRASLSHPKVLAATNEVAGRTGAKSKDQIRSEHGSNMAACERLGMLFEVFEVEEKVTGKKRKPAAAARTLAEVAEPTEANELVEEALDNGVSGWATYHRGAGKGMWCSEVIDPIVQKHDANQENKRAKRDEQDASFVKLQGQVVELVNGALSVELLSTRDLACITRYLFQAVSQTGYSSILTDRPLMLHNLMHVLSEQELVELLQAPPRMTGEPWEGAKLVMAAANATEQADGAAGSGSGAGASGSGSSAYTTFGEKFGQLELPKGYEKYVPIAAPLWLSKALEFKSAEGKRLEEAEAAIAYRFSDDDGGWFVGYVSSQLEDEDDVREVVDGDLTGTRPCNFAVTYADDDETVEHLLSLSNYATSVREAAEGSWVLMAEPLKRGKGKAPASAAPIAEDPIAAVAKMSKAQRRAWRAALAAFSSPESNAE